MPSQKSPLKNAAMSPKRKFWVNQFELHPDSQTFDLIARCVMVSSLHGSCTRCSQLSILYFAACPSELGAASCSQTALWEIRSGQGDSSPALQILGQ